MTKLQDVTGLSARTIRDIEEANPQRRYSALTLAKLDKAFDWPENHAWSTWRDTVHEDMVDEDTDHDNTIREVLVREVIIREDNEPLAALLEEIAATLMHYANRIRQVTNPPVVEGASSPNSHRPW